MQTPIQTTDPHSRSIPHIYQPAKLQIQVHSGGTFPSCETQICSLVRDFEMARFKGGLQSRIAKLLKALIPNDFPGLFRRRLRDLELDEAAIQHFVSQPLGTLSLEFKNIFSSLPLSAPMAILRTWSNGWFTTTRMHESEVFPCIFGCDAHDSLHHYLRCEVLWTLIYSCTKCKYFVFSQSFDERTCICNVSRSNCMRLFAAFSTYHSLRKLHSDIVSNAISSGDFELVLEAALELIMHFAPEADMIGQDVILSCRHGALNSRLNQ